MEVYRGAGDGCLAQLIEIFHAKYKFDIDFMTICDCVKVYFIFMMDPGADHGQDRL